MYLHVYSCIFKHVGLFNFFASELRAHGLQESGLRHVLSEHLSRWVSFSEGSLAQCDVTTGCARLCTMLAECGPGIIQKELRTDSH